MIAGESQEGEDDEHRKVVPRRRVSDLTRRDQIADEEHVRDREPEEREGDPRHVREGLLDRNECETPEQDEHSQGGVQGPASFRSAQERHIRASGAHHKARTPPSEPLTPAAHTYTYSTDHDQPIHTSRDRSYYHTDIAAYHAARAPT